MSCLNPRIIDWRGKRVWLVGASSGIGAALATQLQALGASVALSARREVPLLKLAGEGDRVMSLDVNDPVAMRETWETLIREWGEIDFIVYSAGVYQPMRAWNIDLSVVRETLQTNLQGVYNLLSVVTPYFLDRQTGGLCLIASVAGYTGLPKALVYGPSKAAVINLAQILYTDLSPRGIGVYLVNPGFVETRLTMQNDFNMPALISPAKAAQEIIRGISKGRFEIDFPRRFTWWMKRLSRLPDRLRFYLLKKAAES